MAPMEKDVFAVGNLQEFGDADGAPRFFCEDTDFGMRISARREGGNGNYYWRITQWLMPNYVLVPTAEGLVCRANLFIAIDDENCWWYRVRYHVGRPLSGDELTEYRTGSLDYARLIPGTSHSAGEPRERLPDGSESAEVWLVHWNSECPASGPCRPGEPGANRRPDQGALGYLGHRDREMPATPPRGCKEVRK